MSFRIPGTGIYWIKSLGNKQRGDKPKQTNLPQTQLPPTSPPNPSSISPTSQVSKPWWKQEKLKD